VASLLPLDLLETIANIGAADLHASGIVQSLHRRPRAYDLIARVEDGGASVEQGSEETAMSNRPSVVLVHGFWGGAAHWAKVIVELNGRGYGSLHAVENPLTSLYDDAERTQKMAKQIDGPVLLVGHSYGGAVITQAGDLPNVVGLVYVAAFAPDDGENLGQISEWNAAVAQAAGNVVPDSDGYVWIKQDKFGESFCQDLPADEALVMAVTQKAPVGSTFGNAVSNPVWKKKPSWYQVSTNDRMIHPDSERRMAKRMNPRSTIELDASHASLASQPGAIANLIDQAATALS
jgi:pimeloyl-ACP methyl ester carboxylesterase